MENNNAQAIIETVKALHKPELIELPGYDIEMDSRVQAALVPAGMSLVSVKSLLDEYRHTPRYIKTNAVATTAQSFADYMNRFRRDASAVFAMDDPAKPRLLGMLDYHERDEVAMEDAPSFCTHRISYAFPLSEEMRAWRAMSVKGLVGQEEFATFLQDRAHDIANPPIDWMQVDADEIRMILDLLNLHDDKGQIDDAADAEAFAVEASDADDERYIPRSALYKLRRIRWGSVQRLIQMARGIEITANGKASAGFNPRTGERQVSFVEEHETSDGRGRKVFVPDGFFVHVPVFEAGPRHLMPVRLRYRLQNGKVAWALELVDANRMVRLAVRAVAEQVGKDTNLPVFFGAPESS